MARQKKSTLTMFYILIIFLLCILPLFVYQIVVVILNPPEDDQSVRLAYHMGLINKVDMVCLSPVGYGV